MSLNDSQKKALTDLAHYSLDFSAKHAGKKPDISLRDFPDALTAPGACFVTLEKSGELRGCIGSLEARDPLVYDVVNNTVGAAFSDPRFAPVQLSELQDITISLSVLSPPEAMNVKDEADLLQQLHENVDGLILEDGYHRATFLPSVWRQLPDKQQFLQQLKLKAGLSKQHWSPNIKFWRYSTEYFA
jgi:AmmeMemoRadiSam system protein A